MEDEKQVVEIPTEEEIVGVTTEELENQEREEVEEND